MQETDTQWSQCRCIERFISRLKSLVKELSHYSASFNKHDEGNKLQFGGTMTLAKG